MDAFSTGTVNESWMGSNLARTTDLTALAMAMAIVLNESGVDPQKISIAGYAQYRPAASNDTREGRRANRRVVDLVVVSTETPTTGKSATY